MLPMARRLVFVGVVAMVFQLVCKQLDLPLEKLVRNMFSSSQPLKTRPKYTAECSAASLASDVTVVVTVKDACSQTPGFLASLRSVAGPDTALILTYPDLKSCAPEALGVTEESWSGPLSLMALPPRSSPMVGWLRSADVIKTPYALLLHNDGYALDDFFLCELVGALKKRVNESYVVAAPMLFESKADGSLAAHATQSRLRVVDGTVRHDHSLRRALNRGFDLEEGDQADFLEDHGFLIKTSAISTVVDPTASYTLEYVDMILSLKSQNFKVVFVPTARLEFRIAEFSWRDVPYFMYKRSEATCHGTRDYLAQKWQAKFPNTGFWTYIKYTIVEDHVYPESELALVPWTQQASLALGFFQMAGYNRYEVVEEGSSETSAKQQKKGTYLDLLEKVDASESLLGPKVVASRDTARPLPTKVRTAPRAADLLPTFPKPFLPTIEADMPLEYLPFAIAKVHFPNASCAAALDDWADDRFPSKLCGVAVWHEDMRSCDCYVNLPTFKSRGLFVSALAKLASLLKIPSRVTTYLEMALGSTNPAESHVKSLKSYDNNDLFTFDLFTCGGAKDAQAPLLEPCPDISFRFTQNSRVTHFNGRPATPKELLDSMRALTQHHHDTAILKQTIKHQASTRQQ